MSADGGPDTRGPHGLTALERGVLDLFLAGDDVPLAALRRQLQLSRVARREFTGVGFFTYFTVPEDAPRASLLAQATLTGVFANIDGLEHGAGFILFLSHGQLDNLEGFTFAEPWPDTIQGFSLSRPS